MSNAGTDWNKHNGVGATLLENWVEERSTEDYIANERQIGHKLDRLGHKNILASPDGNGRLETTCQASYKKNDFDQQVHRKQGRIKTLLEQKWREQIIQEIVEEERKSKIVPPTEFVSVFQEDFGHKDLYPNLQFLGHTKPTEEEIAKYQFPISFWSDHASKYDGNTICSITGSEFRQLEENQRIRFGRHAAFSTPVEEYQGEIPK